MADRRKVRPWLQLRPERSSGAPGGVRVDAADQLALRWGVTSTPMISSSCWTLLVIVFTLTCTKPVYKYGHTTAHNTPALAFRQWV